MKKENVLNMITSQRQHFLKHVLHVLLLQRLKEKTERTPLHAPKFWVVQGNQGPQMKMQRVKRLMTKNQGMRGKKGKIQIRDLRYLRQNREDNRPTKLNIEEGNTTGIFVYDLRNIRKSHTMDVEALKLKKSLHWPSKIVDGQSK